MDHNIMISKAKVRIQSISTGEWIKIGGAAMLIAAVFEYKDEILGLLAVIKDRQAVIEYVSSFGALAPVLLVTTIMLQVIVAIIPGHLLMFTSGYLLGFSNGFLLTWLTVVAASQLTFHMARRAGKPLVYRFASRELIDKWNRISEKQGMVFFIFSFMLPIFPVDVMSYVAGFTEISNRRYMAANLIGHIPVAVMMNLAGAYGLDLSPKWIVGFVGVGVVALALWLRYQNQIEAKLNISDGSAK